jgi:hypothetical protein
MKFVSLSSFLLLFGVHFCRISANTNQKIERQASNYEFPGSARIKRADSYYQPTVRKQYEELIDQYEPSPRAAAAQSYSPSVADPSEYSGQSYSQPASYRAGSRSRTTLKDEEAAKLAAEEEEKKPDRLALLLQESKFACGEKKDGYYADESVGCQVFHYCVSGAKHSWQCPENTVFHQIHLNCVPAAQDICQQSSKFHVVNDYLYKELDQRGPNNSIRYHQRYYPEGFDFGGDTLSQVLPPSQPQPQRPRTSTYDAYDSDSYADSRGNSRSQPETYPSYQSYPAPAPVRAQPAPRTVYKPVARTAPPAYSPPAYTQPAYTTLAQTVPTTRRPVTYSTPNAYPTSYSDPSDSDYSSGSSYSLPRDSEYASSVPTYSAPSSSYSAPSSGYSAPSSSYSAPSSGYSAPSSSYSAPSTSNAAAYPAPSSYTSSSAYSPSLSSSSYPSSSSASSAGASTFTSYKPVQSVKPASYPNRPLGIPIASFRVAASPGYGSSAQASRIRSAAFPMSSGFSLGAFNSELASGVKYDEEY